MVTVEKARALSRNLSYWPASDQCGVSSKSIDGRETMVAKRTCIIGPSGEPEGVAPGGTCDALGAIKGHERVRETRTRPAEKHTFRQGPGAIKGAHTARGTWHLVLYVALTTTSCKLSGPPWSMARGTRMLTLSLRQSHLFLRTKNEERRQTTTDPRWANLSKESANLDRQERSHTSRYGVTASSDATSGFKIRAGSRSSASSHSALSLL